MIEILKENGVWVQFIRLNGNTVLYVGSGDNQYEFGYTGVMDGSQALKRTVSDARLAYLNSGSDSDMAIKESRQKYFRLIALASWEKCWERIYNEI